MGPGGWLSEGIPHLHSVRWGGGATSSNNKIGGLYREVTISVTFRHCSGDSSLPCPVDNASRGWIEFLSLELFWWGRLLRWLGKCHLSFVWSFLVIRIWRVVRERSKMQPHVPVLFCFESLLWSCLQVLYPSLYVRWHPWYLHYVQLSISVYLIWALWWGRGTIRVLVIWGQ